MGYRKINLTALLASIMFIVLSATCVAVLAADDMPTFTEDNFKGCIFAPDLEFDYMDSTVIAELNYSHTEAVFGTESSGYNYLVITINYYLNAGDAIAEFQKNKDNALQSIASAEGIDGRGRLVSQEQIENEIGFIIHAPTYNTDLFWYYGRYCMLSGQHYVCGFEVSGPVEKMSEQQITTCYGLAKDCIMAVLNAKDRKLWGKVTNAWGEPLPRMMVKLSYNRKEYETTTDLDGNYEFPFSDSFGKKATLSLVMQCRDNETTYFTIVSDATEHTPHTVVQEFTIQNENDLKHDAIVEDSKRGTEYLGDIYRDMVLAAAFYEEVLKVRLEPCTILPYSSGKTLYAPLELGIQIRSTDTVYKDFGFRSPYLFFHEYAHHVMYCIYGRKFPAPPAGTTSKEYNHGGFVNPSTSDSLVEGFADFMSAVIRQYLENSQSAPNTAYANDINLRVWDSFGHAEEDAVCGVLWDLYDVANPSDGDSVQLSLDEIWAVLKTYRADMYEVYKGFTETYPAKKAQIDQVFLSHGFFADKNEGNKQYDYNEPLWGNADRGEFIDLANPIQRDIGESIGQATNYQRPERHSEEPWPNHFIKTGTDYAFYRISFVFTGHSYLNYDLYQEQRDGFIYVPVPPDNYDVQIKIEGYGTDITTGNPLNFTNQEFIDNYETVLEQGYFREHDFQLTGPTQTRPEPDPERVNPGSTQCIASSVLGMNDPRLETLRQFRDEMLSKSDAGKKIINAYYTGSAKIIPVLDRHPNMKKAARLLLEGVVQVTGGFSKIAFKDSAQSES